MADVTNLQNTTATPFLWYIPGTLRNKKQIIQSDIHVDVFVHCARKVLAQCSMLLHHDRTKIN